MNYNRAIAQSERMMNTDINPARGLAQDDNVFELAIGQRAMPLDRDQADVLYTQFFIFEASTVTGLVVDAIEPASVLEPGRPRLPCMNSR